MIITVQNFLNELELLRVKCETLKGIVNLFVVAESPVTFTGINKPMLFAENRAMFEQYPICYIDLSGVPDTKEILADPWVREFEQRKAVLSEIRKINPKIVIWGDTDETPRPEAIEQFVASGNEIANLEMDMLLYYFNREHPDKWRYQRIAKWRGEYAARGDFNHPMIHNAGWHFEYFGDKQTLLDKINASSHAVDVGGRSFWQSTWRDEKPALPSCSEYPLEKLPPYVIEHKDTIFKKYFL